MACCKGCGYELPDWDSEETLCNWCSETEMTHFVFVRMVCKVAFARVYYGPEEGKTARDLFHEWACEAGVSLEYRDTVLADEADEFFEWLEDKGYKGLDSWCCLVQD